MNKMISYFYEKLPGVGDTDDLEGMIELHTKSFEAHGWTVIHLDESDSKQHPLYEFLNDENSVFATSRNGWSYTRACYMRWLAYASAGHFFADFDIINYGFTFEDALDLRRTAGGPTFISGATAIGLFQGAEYNEITNAFLSYARSPFIRGMLQDDVNDMTVLLECRPDLFAVTQNDDDRIARDYSCPGWDKARLVHFPYHYTKPPRVETVLAKRPPFLEAARGQPVLSSHMSRSEVINGVLSLFEAPRYLEIGVNTGQTFFDAKAAHKVAVDPSFLFDVKDAQQRYHNSEYYPVTSDFYFGDIGNPNQMFDVIYLDGLHTFEQTLRDFCNAIAFLKSDGVIIIDDVIPASFHAALSDAAKAWHVRTALEVRDGMWMGDVYKLVFFIETFFQQYAFATLVENHGQLIVWKSQRQEKQVAVRQVEDIARIPYENVILNLDRFRRMPYYAIISELKKRT